ncbi:MATE family efflux transporter [Spiroplasma endosymbiont of Labia minor]|uniref:MATE family efflux transporter n=1 Tax=Spiroplasma endosymbiont of Labia minor TaxID=3066305 RepID=UPI0030CEF54B
MNKQIDIIEKNERKLLTVEEQKKLKNLKLNVTWYKVQDFKGIVKAALPIFIQLFFDLLITQINMIMISWYKDGAYFPVVSKITVAFTFLQFTPSFVASGTLIVCGNLIGQRRYSELNQVIISGVIINFLICCGIYTIVALLSEYLLETMGAQNVAIENVNGQIVEINELQFAQKYYYVLLTRLVIMSIAQVYISALQAIKKSIHVTIGAVISNFIDATIVSIMLFAAKINPFWISLSIPIAGLFQLIYMYIIANKLIDHKTNSGFFKNIKLLFVKETLRMGFPMTIEMGLWNVANLISNVAIAHLGSDANTYYEQNKWLEFHRAINSIQQYTMILMISIATVTSVRVSTKIGQKDLDGAYEEGINCWKLQFILQVFQLLF